YEEYKATREAMPDDMIPQIGRIKEIVELMNIPLYIKPGFEADDIIGTAVRLAEKKGMISYAVTPDKDYMQLVTEKTIIAKPGRGSDEVVFYDVKKVKEDYGFEPKLMIDYLAIIGDSSDNIPGVRGIGPKGALPLLQKFGSLESIYKNLDKIDKPGILKKLEESKENAFLSKELATINCKVPMEFDFNKAKFEKPQFDKLRDLFIELEFKNLYTRLIKVYDGTNEQKEISVEELSTSVQFDKSKSKYELITSRKDAQKLADKLSKNTLIVFDTETDSLDPFELNILGASFSNKTGEGYFIAIDPGSKIFSDGKIRLPVDEFKKIFKPLFENYKIKKVCQNGKYDISVMRGIGIKVENFYFDTMVASYIIDPDQKHGMDNLSQKYLSYQPILLSSLIGEKKDPTKLYDIELVKLSDYASEDADITFQLYEILNKEIKKEKLEIVAYDVDFPLVPVLEAMEFEGVKIDKSALNSFSKDLQKLITGYTKKIHKEAGEEFNISSPKQLQVILFEKLGLASGRKTKTGFSTDARALDNLRGEHKIIDIILDYRQATKLKSTYADALPNLINSKTGRVHTDFNQTIAATGRLSSINPNLQNIPIRTEMGREIRRAFVPREKNYVLLSADYSQIELRLLAAICKDPALMKAFKSGEDIHRSTAALVFMVDPEDVTPDMRRKAKEVNFGIMYGMGAFGLSQRLGISLEEADAFIKAYFISYPGVQQFMLDIVDETRENGYVTTLLNRRRNIPEINSDNRRIRYFTERTEINTPIQG
ncbi:MAG: DNA polymerase I, partial [Ignavibacteriaceae bacterium]|nr:DNA polymerase I [Ignavibacteriaceae bacterium]